MAPLVLALALSLSSPAHAGDPCDAKQLSKDLTEATPTGKAAAFSALAACDPAAAAKVAPATFQDLLYGPEANKAAVAAVGVGAADTVRDWAARLQSDERASALMALGESCTGDPKVQKFFLDSATKLGNDFWTNRWYRALGACHAQSVQDLLWAELDKGVGPDRSRFSGVLEAYARNQGGAAVPKLEGLLERSADNEEASIYVVNSFADAARVGSTEGMDHDAAKAAIASIVKIAPKLKPKAVEQARVILQALGDEEQADKLAAVRYKTALQEDGTILWGVMAVENATCKKGKTQQRIHSAKVFDPGNTWADQLYAKVEASVNVGWSLDLAKKCKGEGEVVITVPSEPFVDEAAWRTWVEQAIFDLENTPVDKRIKLDENPLRI